MHRLAAFVGALAIVASAAASRAVVTSALVSSQTSSPPPAASAGASTGAIELTWQPEQVRPPPLDAHPYVATVWVQDLTRPDPQRRKRREQSVLEILDSLLAARSSGDSFSDWTDAELRQLAECEADGAPPISAWTVLARLDTRPPQTVAGLAPGRYRAKVDSLLGTLAAAEFEVVAGATTPVELQPSRPRPLRGALRAPEGWIPDEFAVALIDAVTEPPSPSRRVPATARRSTSDRSLYVIDGVTLNPGPITVVIETLWREYPVVIEPFGATIHEPKEGVDRRGDPPFDFEIHAPLPLDVRARFIDVEIGEPVRLASVALRISTDCPPAYLCRSAGTLQADGLTWRFQLPCSFESCAFDLGDPHYEPAPSFGPPSPDGSMRPAGVEHFSSRASSLVVPLRPIRGVQLVHARGRRPRLTDELFATPPRAHHLVDGESVTVEILGGTETTNRLRLARPGPIRIELPAGVATPATFDVEVPRVGFVEQRVEWVAAKENSSPN
jgi:hypothetical protein